MPRDLPMEFVAIQYAREFRYRRSTLSRRHTREALRPVTPVSPLTCGE